MQQLKDVEASRQHLFHPYHQMQTNSEKQPEI